MHIDRRKVAFHSFISLVSGIVYNTDINILGSGNNDNKKKKKKKETTNRQTVHRGSVVIIIIK